MAIWIFVYLCLFQYAYTRRIVEKPKIYYLNPGDSVQNNNSGLKIYCHNASSKYLAHMWRTMTMHLNINTDSYVLYDGKTSEEIQRKYNENQGLWNFNPFDTGKQKQLKINPFEDACIGVHVDSSSESGYIMSMTETRVNVWKLTIMLIGIVIFWCAPMLSRNSLFYYGCGIVFGVTTSLIILIYVAGKLVPRGRTMYLIFAGTMSVFLAQALWDNAQLIVIQYREWVMWYILVTSLISFVICYRFGPVTNTKTKQIIQWFLQIVGLIMVYNSSYFLEASISYCIVLLLVYNFPKVAVERGRRYWRRTFPEKRKLLSEDEYHVEGIRQTQKALKELKSFCSSPECNPWKTVLRLNDPKRFAKFIEGNSHLLEDEILGHNVEISKIIDNEYDDDDDDDNEYDSYCY